MLRTGVNLWGSDGGTEAQRADLWQLDLSSVITGVSEQPFVLEALGLSLEDLPSKSDIDYFPQRLTLPVIKTRHRPVMQGTCPVIMPGYNEAVEGVRVEFLHDNATTGVFSKIFALIMAWNQLPRIGRRSHFGTYVPIPDHRYRPNYRFDVVVRLIQPGTEANAVDVGSAYLLEKCWLKAHQPNELSTMDPGSLHLLTGDLQPQDIRLL